MCILSWVLRNESSKQCKAIQNPVRLDRVRHYDWRWQMPRPPAWPLQRERTCHVSAATYFLQLLKTMKHEIQIYDFFKSYLWIPKTIMFPSLIAFRTQKTLKKSSFGTHWALMPAALIALSKSKGKTRYAFAWVTGYYGEQTKGSFVCDFWQS